MKITVRNKKTYKGTGIYIGRPSVFGNPYSHLDGTLAIYKTDSLEESIRKYEEDLPGFPPGLTGFLFQLFG